MRKQPAHIFYPFVLLSYALIMALCCCNKQGIQPDVFSVGTRVVYTDIVVKHTEPLHITAIELRSDKHHYYTVRDGAGVVTPNIVDFYLRRP